MTHVLVTTGLGWPAWLLVLVVIVVVAVLGALFHIPLMWLSKSRSLADPSDDHVEIADSEVAHGKVVRSDVAHSEIAGHFLGVIGVVYAVLLGFVVVTAWQQSDHAQEIAMQERHDIENLFDVIGAYKLGRTSRSREIQSFLRQYAYNMLGEVQQMRRGQPLCLDTNFGNETEPACQPYDRQRASYGQLPPSRLNNDLISVIRDKIAALPITTLADQSVYQQGVILFQDFVGVRDHRRRHYREPMPFILWMAYLFGAIIAIAVPYLGPRHATRQFWRTVSLSVLIGLVSALTLVFDHPFTGSAASQESAQWCTTVERFDWDLHHGVVPVPGCSDNLSRWDEII